jgi:general secretion pathway protein D
VLVFAVGAAAESAKSLYKKGQDLEARQDYINAFEAYNEAYNQKPTDLKYRIAYQRTRFLAAAAHVNKGQVLRESGNLAEAMNEFVYAAKIDPSSVIATQEIRRTKALLDAATGAPSGTPPPTPPVSPITKRLEEAAGPIELAPISNQPLTLEISNDSKNVYETIGKLAGVNVLFDPEYVPRRVTLKLNGVSLQESLDILAFHSGSFWRPVTPNTIYVAANTPAKRKELEQNVLKTFYLSNISTPTDMQDIVTALRTVLDLQKLSQVNSQNAIIIRDTPDKIAMAEKLIGDLDKGKPEVIVDIAIMQVRRDKLRNLGVTPPASATVQLTGPTTSTTTSTTTTGTTTPATTSNNLTLNSFQALKATDFAVSIPAATANFLFTDNNSKLLQNPQIRASDGVKASLKIGDRVPIATGSIGNPLGGVLNSTAGLVNTQFQYLDVGVNIDITPRVYPDREIGLKLSLDVSSVTGTSTIGGISQPIISQRKIEHDIRLKDGEVNLVGGIFEQTDTNSVAGLPWLAQLPFFKYFFSSENKERIDNEIVFILIPHVIRAQEITALNNKAIDIGTANYLDLRRVSQPTGTASPAPQTPAPQSAPVQPPAAAQPQTPPAASPPAGGTALFFDPAVASPASGSTFSVNVSLRSAADLFSAPVQISYDPSVLQFVSIANGDILTKDGQAVALVHREDSGSVQASATRPPGSGGVSGDGTLFTLTFQAKKLGQAVIGVRPMFRNGTMQVIPVPPAALTVTVH